MTLEQFEQNIMLVITSYRKEYVVNCGGSCRCDESMNESDYEIQIANNEEEAASYIADRIKKHPDAFYVHHVFDSWDTLVEMASRKFTWDSFCQAEESILSPFVDFENPFDVGEKLPEQASQINETILRIRASVKAKLAEFKNPK